MMIFTPIFDKIVAREQTKKTKENIKEFFEIMVSELIVSLLLFFIATIILL